MHDDDDLRDLPNPCRLFPLPGVVLLPHAVLPLHIFEPRYRQMTEDALASDRLITIVQLRPSAEEADPAAPPVLERVGCLGLILDHERLPDGRFNFLLLGRKRVRLTREVPSEKLYRIAEVEVIEDQYPTAPCVSQREELSRLFQQVTAIEPTLDPDVQALLEADVPLGVLTDIVAHALGLPATIKQALLEESQVARRAEDLIGLLRQLIQQLQDPVEDLPDFPPPFSAN